MTNGATENPHLQEAQALAEKVKDKGVVLGLRPAEGPASLRERQLNFSSAAGDKGLSYLAKRLYVQAGYNSSKALDAAILLSSKFIERIGTPVLHDGDSLRVNADKAILTYKKADGSYTLEEIDLEDAALKEKLDAQKSTVMVQAGVARVELHDVLSPEPKELKNQLIQKVPNVIVYGHDAFGTDVEGCSVYSNDKYCYVVHNSKTGAYKVNLLDSVNDPHRISGTNTVVAWTQDFDAVKKALA